MNVGRDEGTLPEHNCCIGPCSATIAAAMPSPEDLDAIAQAAHRSAPGLKVVAMTYGGDLLSSRSFRESGVRLDYRADGTVLEQSRSGTSVSVSMRLAAERLHALTATPAPLARWTSDSGPDTFAEELEWRRHVRLTTFEKPAVGASRRWLDRRLNKPAFLCRGAASAAALHQSTPPAARVSSAPRSSKPVASNLQTGSCIVGSERHTNSTMTSRKPPSHSAPRALA